MTDDRREYGTFRSGSSHHVILSLLDDEGPQTRQELLRKLTPTMADGTMSGSVADLYERRLIDREKVGERPPTGGAPPTEYFLTDHGQEELADVDHLSVDEWAGQ